MSRFSSRVLRRLTSKSLPLFLLGAALFLYLRSFIPPYTLIYQGYNAPVFLLEATRMMRGELIYRDFFEFTFPGTQLAYLSLFKLFGPRLWIPGALLIVIGVCLGYLAVVISRRFFSGRAALLPAIAYVVFIFGNTLDATHHWFSLTAVVAALALMIEERSPARVFGTGLLCGLATCFTQTRGMLASLGFAAFLTWEWRATAETRRWLLHRQALLLWGFLSTSLPLPAYYAWKVGLARFLYCTFVFPLKYYSAFYRNTFSMYMVDVPEFSGPAQAAAVAIWLFIHLLQPLIYLLFLERYRCQAQRRPDEPWARLMLVNFVGLALFLAIVSTPNWFKIASASLPALVLFVWFISAPSPINLAARSVLWVAVLATAAVEPVITQLDLPRTLRLPAGPVTSGERGQYEELRWLSERTKPGEFIYEANDADLYFPLGVKNPAQVSFLTSSDYTRPEQAEQALQAIRKDRVRWVIWSVWLDLADPSQVSADHLRALRAYLRQHYRMVKTFEDGGEAWVRY